MTIDLITKKLIFPLTLPLRSINDVSPRRAFLLPRRLIPRTICLGPRRPLSTAAKVVLPAFLSDPNALITNLDGEIRGGRGICRSATAQYYPPYPYSQSSPRQSYFSAQVFGGPAVLGRAHHKRPSPPFAHIRILGSRIWTQTG